MRAISAKLTPELLAHYGAAGIDKADAFPVTTFRQLVEHVARLAYINNDELLFFRGQSNDYRSRAGGTTLYPGIYRGDAIPEREMRHRFDMLDQACKLLVEKWRNNSLEGLRDVRLKRYVQWSILQHYEVHQTPLLDVTHSLRVACSFAQLKRTGGTAYVYVLGLPHVTNRISINSEHDIVNVRLLSICPPAALRPHFQEGYMAGTSDVTTDFDSKTELDFRNRLIAKFAIPDKTSFWGRGFNVIPDTALYPRGDRIKQVCDEIKTELKDELQVGDVGLFMRDWVELEEIILGNARKLTDRNLSLGEAISSLYRLEIISSETAQNLQVLRRFRNQLVHAPKHVSSKSVKESLEHLQAVLSEIKQVPRIRQVAGVKP